MKAVQHSYWQPVARSVYTEDFATCVATGNGSQSQGIEIIMGQLQLIMDNSVFLRVEKDNVFVGFAITDETKTIVKASKIRMSKFEMQMEFQTFVNSLVYGNDYDPK